MKVYLELFWIFFKIGAFTLGGGYAMVPIIQAEIVAKKKWIEEEEFVKLRGKNYFCVGTAIMLSALLLQLGRINIALDYDSLRYGLRSLSVLIGNTGIYDKLGTVNDVYVYPKGLEILTLALNNKMTFGFVLSFNYTCAILMLICVH